MKALITGASSGIGKDMAYYLSELGYDFIIVGRRKKLLEQIKKDIKTDVKVISVDLSDEKKVFELYDNIKKENIDILVNNAGFGIFGAFDKTDIRKEIEMINLNIKATHILTKLFLNNFLRVDKGIILNVASTAAFFSGPNMNTYYATKNYILRLSLAIYQELKEINSNVRISVLCPGPTETEFNEVANAQFKIRAQASKYVAKYAIDKALRKKLIIIPGILNKVFIYSARIIPEYIKLKIVSKIQRNKFKD